MLIDSGAKVNITDESLDYSPLMDAASDRDIQTLKVLIDHGAQINFKNKEGKSALALACWTDNNKEVIEYLVKKGADINIQDHREETPAMNAVTFLRWENIKTLADLGADLNIIMGRGFTLLDYVTEENLKNYLITKGEKNGIKPGQLNHHY